MPLDHVFPTPRPAPLSSDVGADLEVVMPPVQQWLQARRASSAPIVSPKSPSGPGPATP